MESHFLRVAVGWMMLRKQFTVRRNLTNEKWVIGGNWEDRFLNLYSHQDCMGITVSLHLFLVLNIIGLKKK